MQKQNFFSGNEDILFHLKHRVDWDLLFNTLDPKYREAVGAASAEEYRNSWFDVMSTLGEICGTTIADNAKLVEEQEMGLQNGVVTLPPAIVENMETLKAVGFSAISINPSFGGLGAPFVFEAIGMEMINRACPSTALNACWFGSIGHIIERFGSKDMADHYVTKIASESWSGSMALTEPDAGSDLGAMKTYAEKQADGSWKIYGTKRFISNGQGEISLVLARKSKEDKGLESICIFLAPRAIDGKDNFVVSKIEEKVGLHGSATCELNFDGSKGWLIGEEGQGFPIMLFLMNDARIAVGFQGIGLMQATFEMASKYASERKTWGKPIAKHELISEKLFDMECELRGARSVGIQASFNQAMMYACEGALKRSGLSNEEKIDLEKRLAKHKQRVRRWTPLIKYYTGEKSFEHARNCLQIHGGYGFTKEYRAEWWVRESLIYALYEGTSQIQALMCVKDTFKVAIRRPTELIEHALGAKLKSFTGDSLKKDLYSLKSIVNSSVLGLLLKITTSNVIPSDASIKDIIKGLASAGKALTNIEDMHLALLHAERICELKCLEALAEALIWDAEVDATRRKYAERFLYRALPKAAMLKQEIMTHCQAMEDRLADKG